MRPGNWRELQLALDSPGAVRSLIEQERPGAVFYCAYDKINPAITVDAAVAAARAAQASGARFVFYSTDMVFDGELGGYTEESPASPVSAYGEMKLEAEALVRAEHAGALVIRTSLLVGSSGDMLRPAYECGTMVSRQPVTLYRDEWRSPTHVDDLVRASWELAALDVTGVYHVAGAERLSRVELGRVLAVLFRYKTERILEADRPPDRPRDTSLDSRRVAALLGWAPRALSGFAAPAAPHPATSHA